MRRNSRNVEKEQGNLKNKIYWIGSILGIAILAFVVTLVVYGNKVNKEASISKMDSNKITNLISNSTEGSKQSEQASTSMGKTVDESKKEEGEKIAINTSNMQKENTPVDNTTKETEETNAPKAKENTKKEEKKEEKEPTFMFPVEGDIIKEFAKDTLVYSQTLNEWITHPGLDIKAESTTVVKAAAEGKVTAIKNDPRYGLTIIVEHSAGFSTVYSNLLTSEFVVVGENVKQGQTMGTVGNTATFEIGDESHLHFEILREGIAADPSMYLNK